MRTLALAALVLAVPAAAQTTAPAPSPVGPAEAGAPDVDPQLVGAWALDEVAEGGELGQLGVEIEEMTCDFDADGTGRVEMEMVQDRDPITSERTFEFVTDDGRIVVPNDDDVTYRVLTDGRLEMTTAGGTVLRFVRAGA